MRFGRLVIGSAAPARPRATWQIRLLSPRAGVRALACGASVVAFLALAGSVAAADPLAGVSGSPAEAAASAGSSLQGDATAPVEVAAPAVGPEAVTTAPVGPSVVHVEPLGGPAEPAVEPVPQPLLDMVADESPVALDPLLTAVEPIVQDAPVVPAGSPAGPSGRGPNDDLRAVVLMSPPSVPAIQSPAGTVGVSSAPADDLAVTPERARQAVSARHPDVEPPAPRRPHAPLPEAATMTLRAGSTEQLPVLGALALSVLLVAFATGQLLAPALVAMRGRPVLVPVPPG